MGERNSPTKNNNALSGNSGEGVETFLRPGPLHGAPRVLGSATSVLQFFETFISLALSLRQAIPFQFCVRSEMHTFSEPLESVTSNWWPPDRHPGFREDPVQRGLFPSEPGENLRSDIEVAEDLAQDAAADLFPFVDMNDGLPVLPHAAKLRGHPSTG